MLASKLITDSINATFEVLKIHLADMSDADLMVRPVPTANHATWQLSHVASLEAMIANTIAPDEKIDQPATLATANEKGTYTCDDPATFPKKDELLAVIESAKNITTKALATMTDDDLAKPAPEAFRTYAATIGNLLMLGPAHTNMHIGQIQVLRRKLGKPNVF